jgi:hypothetical protein
MIEFIRNQQKSIDTITIAIVAYLSLLFKDFLVNKQYGGFSGNIIAILTLVLSIITIGLARRWLLSSKFIDPRQKINGEYIEFLTINDQPRVAIFTIKYSIFDNTFEVTGNLFDPKKRIAISSWSSLYFGFLPNKANNVYYVYDSHNNEENKTTMGTTRLTFIEINNKRFGGQGYIMESDLNSKVYNFDFELLDENIIDRFIGKKQIQSPDDRDQVVRSYSESKYRKQ